MRFADSPLAPYSPETCIVICRACDWWFPHGPLRMSLNPTHWTFFKGTVLEYFLSMTVLNLFWFIHFLFTKILLQNNVWNAVKICTWLSFQFWACVHDSRFILMEAKNTRWRGCSLWRILLSWIITHRSDRCGYWGTCRSCWPDKAQHFKNNNYPSTVFSSACGATSPSCW